MKVTKIWFQQERLVPQLQPKVDDAAKQQLRTLRQQTLQLLQQQRFVCFEKQPLFYFDNRLNCLWLLYDFRAEPGEMFKYITKLKVYAFQNWEIPSLDTLQAIVGEPLFQSGKFKDAWFVSATPDPDGQGYRTLNLGNGALGLAQGSHPILPLHRVAQRDIFSFIVAHSLVPQGIEGVREKLQELYTLTMDLGKKGEGLQSPPPSLNALQQHLLEGDYVRARLPVLEPSTLIDMGKGLWELYHPRKPASGNWVEVTLETPWEARNPELDIREGVVAIDFGTSSTVVACRENGKTRLLRVGMVDFFRKPTFEDYQNPTVLAFIHLPNLLKVWQTEAYRPLTRWEDFHFSHAALNLLRANEADQRIVASILTGFKQWPLTAATDQPLRITDQATETEIILPAESNPMPVVGEPITVSEDDPFDPIELYAYYLGLFINHRSNGLFLDYFMTFPITYPRAARQKIMAAFARGLQRSLPLSLLGSPKMNRFRLREEASEPAAYAACALEELGIEPTAEGTAYAVFDFGGGSTDFDFGVYRFPAPDEEQQGYERVIKHFGASGDMYLGGENLIANLVYLTFLDNLEVCREHHIPFSIPHEAEIFPGHEPFLDHSHVARTNTALMMAKVRQVWEDFQWQVEAEQTGDPQSGQLRRRRLSDTIGDLLNQAIIDSDFRMDPTTDCFQDARARFSVDVELLNRDRARVQVQVTVDQNRLNHFLVQRVGKGIERFFMAMTQAFANREIQPREVHILQAGNSSRSLLVQALFATILQERMFKWEPPLRGINKNPTLDKIRQSIPFSHFIVHRPPQGNPDDPFSPTAKTGVAIGLLKLIPGETLLAIAPDAANLPGEAPFRYFVGRLKGGMFQTVLKQNAPYHIWQELGIPTRGAFVLVYSTSPQAGFGTLRRGAREIQEKILSLPPGCDDKHLFVQATGPNRIEIVLAETIEQILKRPETVTHQEPILLS
ncbi:MAG: hypothetical protein HQL65_15965 [Magnetococcales bacterium]|nr:hypothetical protein [Magnetococcales bacterium]